LRLAAVTKVASPFRCDKCGVPEKQARNCDNHLGLSDPARAVDEYTDSVAAEITAKGAKKVASLKGLRLYECPASYLTAETREMQRALYATEAFKTMPLAGGWADQPCWFVEAYEIYRAELAAAVKDRGDGER